jgi:hypothetical protein
MLAATRDYLQGVSGLKKVLFCLFDQETLSQFESELKIIRNARR